ncbi:MAG: acyl-CoA dehydratase activase-related protein [candidate division WOR-3 bacterium]
MRLGIPRALQYYYHYPIYEKYLRGKGFTLILSPETNKEIKEKGLKLAPPEICLPVKVYIGHCAELKDKVDALFVPRVVRRLINGKPYYGCPKTLGLPDLIRATFPEIKVFELVIDEKEKEKQILGEIKIPGLNLKKRPESLWVMLIAHPYLLFDSGLNFDLIKKIEENGVSVLTPFSLELERTNFLETSDIAWFYEQHLLRAAWAAKERKSSGVILFSSFGCGTSAVTNEIIIRKIIRSAEIPVLNLMVDEHTQETGIETRIESFLEIIKRKKR